MSQHTVGLVTRHIRGRNARQGVVHMHSRWAHPAMRGVRGIRAHTMPDSGPGRMWWKTGSGGGLGGSSTDVPASSTSSSPSSLLCHVNARPPSAAGQGPTRL